MSKKEKKLEDKIDSLLKKKEKNDEINHFLEMFKVINSYLNYRSKLFRATKEFSNNDYHIHANTTHYHKINMYRMDNKKAQLAIRITCDELINALQYYYTGMLREHINEIEV